jgi:ribokinase
LLQLEIPLATVSKAVEIAQTHGTKIVLSPAPARPLSKALLSKIDYLIPNEGELALLSGVEGIETGISCLRGLGVEHLIVTLGESGALVAEKKHQYQLPAIPVTVVDTTAAGDAFVGAFAVALTEGLPLQQAAAWGNAAGALSVTKSGANPSLPTRQALMAFMQEHQQA